MSLKNVTLLFVVAVIIGAIFYIGSRKADVRGTNVSAVSVTSVDQIATSTLSQNFASTTPLVSLGSIKTALTQLAGADKKAGFPIAKEITTPDGFINTGTSASGNPLPITISQYIGKKIILVDFWTYSCINCQRTTPYLNTWYDKYEKDGLIIIGIHTPEFDFEKVYDNVVKAVAKEGIKYPVVLDNDYSTWTAYQNQYWPRKYLIDMAGYVVYDHIGEGAYDETEKKIQDLLMQRAQILGQSTANIATDITTPVGAVTTIQTQSPETYFGSARNEYLANGNPGVSGVQNFVLPQSFGVNSLYLGGEWNIQSQEADAQAGATIEYTFNAKEVYFVAGADTATNIEVLLDGKPVTAKGTDIVTKNGSTFVTVKDERIYHLIDLPQMEQHTLEIKAPAGLKAFTFTFG